MLSRRTPRATPSARYRPRSSGPRCVMTSVIAANPGSPMTGRGGPSTCTIPQMPHIARPDGTRRTYVRSAEPDGAGPGERAQMTGPRRPALRRQQRVRELAQGHAEPLEERSLPHVQLGVPHPALGQQRQKLRPWGRRPTLVHRVCRRLVQHLVAGVPQAPAEIDVLAVEEEALIPAADRLEA